MLLHPVKHQAPHGESPLLLSQPSSALWFDRHAQVCVTRAPESSVDPSIKKDCDNCWRRSSGHVFRAAFHTDGSSRNFGNPIIGLALCELLDGSAGHSSGGLEHDDPSKQEILLLSLMLEENSWAVLRRLA
jgi:hypothetical protein